VVEPVVGGFDLVYNNGPVKPHKSNPNPNLNPNPNPNPDPNPDPDPDPNPNPNPNPNQVKPDKAACYTTRLGCYEDRVRQLKKMHKHHAKRVAGGA